MILLLLDLYVAFDTIDHEILLQRLRVSGGVWGTALAWFKSYLTGRTQSVKIHNTTSKPRLLSYSVPQGSVLGPLLFTLYSAPIASIVRRHGLIAQLYADGTQLYIVFDQDAAAQTIKRIEACVMKIKACMAMNWLNLNDEKTVSLLLRCLRLFFLPPAQHQQHSKSAGYEDNCHHCLGPSHFQTWLLQLSAMWTSNYSQRSCKCYKI